MSAVPVRPARGRGVQREPEAFRARLLTGTDWFKHYYTGERVAILATGSEAASILPEVLHTAASVMVFEESPTWVTPVPVPLGPLRRTVSRIWLRASVPDAWTRRQLTPHKQFDSPRVTVSPSYYAALRDPRARLIHWPAYAIVANGVRCADGVEYQADTIILGATSRLAHSTLPQGSRS